MCDIRQEIRYVRGRSMTGLFEPEQKLQVEFGYYSCHAVQRGDTVLVGRPGRSRPILKQVLVMPGDRFQLKQSGMRRYGLYVNGAPLKTARGELYEFAGKRVDMIRLYETSFSGTMPADTFFVFGTDPVGSLDSTRFGPIKKSDILGRVRPFPFEGQSPLGRL